MKDRFVGRSSNTELVDALQQQRLVAGNRKLARRLADLAGIVEKRSNAMLIKQDAEDRILYLILAGKFEVRQNGVFVAFRTRGNHVGEMALLDPSAKRSASVRAVERSVVACISEASFNVITKQFPEIWKNIGREIAERLRERGARMPWKNKTPKIFLASSREALPWLAKVTSTLQGKITVVPWTAEHVFKPSITNVENLLREVHKCDFAGIFFTPDDLIESRDELFWSPRDNCILELGLFLSVYGRERTFLIKPIGTDLKIPSDLQGFSPIDYNASARDKSSEVRRVCGTLRRQIEDLGPREPRFI